jgi:hypothetical protein
MQSFVRIINKENYGDFVKENPTQHKVVLFTSRKSTPPLLKALSKHFKGRLYFGEIRQTELELVLRFEMKKFPTVFVISDPEAYRGVAYEGVLNRDNLEKFLNQYAYQTIKIEKSVSPKEFTSDIYNKQKICNENDNKNICVLFLLYSDHLIAKENQFLEDLAKKYMNDPIKVYYINPSIYGHFWLSFEEYDRHSKIIILRGKRKKYIPLKLNSLKLDEVTNTIDNVLTGGGSYKKLIKKLNLNVLAYDSREDL